jgi:universal stress protein A
MQQLHSILVPVDFSESSRRALEYAALQENADKELARFASRAQEDGIAIATTRSEPGVPSATIVEIAKNGAYDLIVMGTHGRTGFSRVMLGSVAERVVRLAPCAVLTVRAKEEG